MSNLILNPTVSIDEKKVLDALDKPPVANVRMAMAPFRIEVHLGSRRHVHKMAGILILWESGKRLEGEGDDLMFFCGHEECRMPISSGLLSDYHVDCPHCKLPSFRSPDMKKRFAKVAGLAGGQKEDLRKIPCLRPQIFFENAPPKAIGVMVADQFVKLGRSADVMVHFSPRDIRSNGLTDVQVVDHYDKARAARPKNKVVYPHYRIIRDLSNGVTLESMVAKMLT